MIDRSQLTLPGDATPIALSLPPDLSMAEWQAVGAQLARAERAVMWWIGDWWHYGEHRYGEMAAQALDSDYSYQTWRNAAWVAGKIEPSRRRDGVAWSVHAEVASLPVEQQDQVLDEAESEGWTRSDTRAAVRLLKGVVREAPPPAQCNAEACREMREALHDVVKVLHYIHDWSEAVPNALHDGIREMIARALGRDE